MASDNIYRTKALERVSSPEQLNSYIKVTRPGVWIVLVAMLLLLSVGIYWGLTGSLELCVETRAFTLDGVSYCWLPAEDAVEVRAGMQVRIGDAQGTVTSVETHAMTYDEILGLVGDLDIRTVSTLQNEKVYRVTMDVKDASSGIEDVVIVIDRVRPADLILR